MLRLRSNWLSLGLLIIFAHFTFILFYYPLRIGIDLGLYLHAGKLILAGQKPFVDFFDINPPLIMYLSAPVVWFANVLNIQDIIILKELLFLFALLFAWTTNHLLKPELGNRKAWLISAAFFLVFTNNVIAESFGQRDQLFGMCLVLYLLLKKLRIKYPEFEISKFVITFVGVCFAVTICLKPHYFLHFIVTEVFLFLAVSGLKRKGVFTLEAGITAFVSALYALFMLLLPDPAWTNFWLIHVPEVSNYYGSFLYFPKNYFGPDDFLIMLVGTIVLGMIFNFKKLNCFYKIILLNLVAASAVYFLQLKLFHYHISIIEILLGLLAFSVLCESANSKRLKTLAICGLIAWQVLYYKKITVFYDIDNRGRFGDGKYKGVIAFLKKNTKPDDYVLALSSAVWIDYPLINILKLNTTSRYLFQYPLSLYGSKHFTNGVFSENIDDKHALAKEAEYVEQLNYDIKKNPPKAIYYLANPRLHRQNLPIGFPIKIYLESIGVFKVLQQNGYELTETTADGFYFYMKKELSK